MQDTGCAQPITAFDDLIAPLSREQFLRLIFGKKAVYLSGAADRFAYLLTWEDLESILSHQPIEYLKLRVTKDGVPLPPEKYTQTTYSRFHESKRRQLDTQRLTELCRAGAALVLNDFPQFHEPIRSLMNVMAAALHTEVEAIAFAGWNSSRTFPVHWDVDDTFIVQISGRKHWRIFEPLRPHPLSEDQYRNAEPPKEVYWEGEVKAGDLLHIPRGWWHEVQAYDDPSLHVTFGVRPPTGLDLARALLSEVSFMRANLPRQQNPADLQQYVADFRTAMQAAMDDPVLVELLTKAPAAAASRLDLRPPLVSLSDPNEIDSITHGN